MKRNYVTPVIAVEHYNLTQSIAACITKINIMTRDCVLNDSDATRGMQDLARDWGYFMDTTGCGELAFGMSDQDGTCYHTNANAAFTS